MKHMSGEIPEQFRPEWEEASRELAEASEELHRANKRYHEAILVRLALKQCIEEHEANG